MMKQKWHKWIGVIVIGASLLVGCSQVTTEEAVNQGIAVNIGNAEAQITQDYFRAVGKITSSDSIAVTPGTSGVVEVVNVKVGDKVSKGDVLYKIDNTTAKASESQTLATLKSTMDNLKLQLDRAIETRDQMLTLYNSGALSVVSYQTYEDQVTLLENQYKSAETVYLEQAVSLNEALSDYSVTSPTAGTVVSIDLDVGERVTSQTSIEIKADHTMTIEVGLTFKQRQLLKKISEVAFKSPDSETWIKASIGTLDTQVDEVTNLYDLTLILDENLELSDGAYVTVRFYEPERTVLTLPSTGIKYIGQTTYAFYVNENQASRVEVDLGKTIGDRIEVINLPEDKIWIVSGIDQMQDGIRIAPVE